MKSPEEELVKLDKNELIAEVQRLRAENKDMIESITGSVYLTWQYNLETDTFNIGKGSMKILGFPEEHQLSYHELLDRIHPDDRTVIEDNFNRYFDLYPDINEYNIRILDAHNKYRWIASKGRLFKDKSGEPYKIAGALRDITARKELESEGQSFESRFRVLAEHAREGIVIYDTENRITDLNEAAETIFGYPRQEIIGQPLHNLIDRKTYDKIKKSINSGEYIEFKATRADGNHIYTEIIVKEVRSGIGVIIIHDIHTHKLAQLKLREYQQKLEIVVQERTEELRQSKQSFEALLDNIDGMAYQYVPHGENWSTTFVSKGAKDLTGYSAEQYLSEEIKVERDIIHSEYSDEIWQSIKACLEEGKSFNVQYPITTKNGDNKWVIDRGKAVTDNNGHITSLEGLILDITKEKQRQDELKEAQQEIINQHELLQQRERSYSALLTNLQGMAYRVLADMETVTFISDGAYGLTGYRPDDIKHARQFFEKNIVKRGYQKMVGRVISKALKKQEPYEVSYEIVCKDGTEKWVSERGIGVYSQDGHLKALEGLIIDITEAKTREKQLRLAQETIDKAPLIIEWVKEDGSFYYVNDEALRASQFSKEEFATKRVFELDPTLTEAKWAKLFKNRNNENVKDRDVTYTRKDGTAFPALINASNIEYDGITYNISYISDISKLKEIESELKQANSDLSASEEELKQQSEELQTLNDNLEIQKIELENTIHKLQTTRDQLIHTEKMASLGVLVAGIAHELNNPIGYIKSSSEAMTELLADLQEEIGTGEADMHEVKTLSEDFIKMTENINAGAVQAAEIIKGLRTFSRLDKQKIEKHNIHNTLDNVLLMLQNSYKYTIKVHRDFGKIPEIECAPGQINQVFMNLINNAIQAIEGQGNIWIKTEQLDGRVIVTVKDDGMGIDESIRNRILEPFFTTKEPGQGTGLGLSISLGIVQDHNGSLLFESSDEGSVFVVSLPVCQSNFEN